MTTGTNPRPMGHTVEIEFGILRAEGGSPRLGALEFVRTLRDEGYEVLIISEEPSIARQWLEDQGFAETHCQREHAPSMASFGDQAMRMTADGGFAALLDHVREARAHREAQS